MTLESFLRSLGLESLAPALRAAGVNDPRQLTDELLQHFGVVDPARRAAVLQAASAPAPAPLPPAGAASPAPPANAAVVLPAAAGEAVQAAAAHPGPRGGKRTVALVLSVALGVGAVGLLGWMKVEADRKDAETAALFSGRRKRAAEAADARLEGADLFPRSAAPPPLAPSPPPAPPAPSALPGVSGAIGQRPSEFGIGPGSTAGETRPEPSTQLRWVWMPPGSFDFGCTPGDGECQDDEKPSRRETVQGFWMLQTEVTVAAYGKCVAAGTCPEERPDGDDPTQVCNAPQGRKPNPMNCVTQTAATTFCAYVGGRLPSGVEWEYAARSGRSNRFPWGNEPVSGSRANFCDRNCLQALTPAWRQQWVSNHWVVESEDDGWSGTAPVGSIPGGDTVWGLKDMSGNVAEWTSTPKDAKGIEVRGGGWRNPPSGLRASDRTKNAPTDRSPGVGFRCVQ